MIVLKENEVQHCCEATQMIAEGIKPIPIEVGVCSVYCALAISEAVASEGYGPVVDGQRIRKLGEQ